MTAVQRPRFRVSQARQRNLRRHPKALRFRKVKQTFSARKRRRSNLPAPRGTSGFRPLRWRPESPVSATYGTLLRQRRALRELYGLRRAGTRSAFARQWRSRWQKTLGRRGQLGAVEDSPFAPLERRADVLLHRSGLFNSVAQARQAVTHGLVWRRGEKEVDVLLRPGTAVEPGTLLTVDPAHWKTYQQAAALAQWRLWLQAHGEPTPRGRNLPSYLEVDFERGAVVLLGVPRRREILLAADRSPNADVLAVRR